jgi:heme iron utilization protein
MSPNPADPVVPASSDVAAARALVSHARSAVLSTAHAYYGGWPFGSIVPYALLGDLDPVLMLSDVAEHTKNLAADPRASLLIADPAAADDPQSGARVTLLGRCAVPSGAAKKAAGEAYFARFPDARAHLSAHGFSPHVLRVERVRWIAGFGSMGWTERDAWESTASADLSAAGDDAEGDPLAPHAAAILEHVNRDHADAVLTLARAHGAPAAASARMTAVNSAGFVLHATPAAGGKTVHLQVLFDPPARTPDEARRAMIAMIAAGKKSGG